MNFLVPKNAGNFLSSWETVSFSRRTMLNAVSKIITESRPATDCIETAMNKLIFVRWTVVVCVRDWSHSDLWEWRQRLSRKLTPYFYIWWPGNVTGWREFNPRWL
jgi:hypothetical protein